MRKATSSLAPLMWQDPLHLDARKRKALIAKRDSWLREIDPSSLFHSLFDLIPGVYFFAKNRQGEIMFTCKASRDLYHIPDETAAIGLTDFDVNPSEMAEAYVHDDTGIFETGLPVLNRVELWFNEQGIPDWFVVNKMPIRSRTGEIIGIMGFSQSYEGRAKLLTPFRGIAKAVAHIRENYQEEIAIADLARLAGLSLRQLQRKFVATFGVGPQQFLIKTRLLAACRALRESNETLTEVAFTCGFP